MLTGNGTGDSVDALNAPASTTGVVVQGGDRADAMTGGNAHDYLDGTAGADILIVTPNARFDAVFDLADTGDADDDGVGVPALGANFDTIAEIPAATSDYSGTSLIT